MKCLIVFVVILIIMATNVMKGHCNYDGNCVVRVQDPLKFVLEDEPNYVLYEQSKHYNYAQIDIVTNSHRLGEVDLVRNALKIKDDAALSASEMAKLVSFIYITYLERYKLLNNFLTIIKGMTQFKMNILYLLDDPEVNVSDLFLKRFGYEFVEQISFALGALTSMYLGMDVLKVDENYSYYSYIYNPGVNYVRANDTPVLRVIGAFDVDSYYSHMLQLIEEEMFTKNEDFKFNFNYPGLGKIGYVVKKDDILSVFSALMMMSFNAFYVVRDTGFQVEYLAHDKLHDIYNRLVKHVKAGEFDMKNKVDERLIQLRDFRKDLQFSYAAHFKHTGRNINLKRFGSGTAITAFAAVLNLLKGFQLPIQHSQLVAFTDKLKKDESMKNHELEFSHAHVRDNWFVFFEYGNHPIYENIIAEFFPSMYANFLVNMELKGYYYGWSMNDYLSGMRNYETVTNNRMFSFSDVYFDAESMRSILRSHTYGHNKGFRTKMFGSKHGLKIMTSDVNLKAFTDIPILCKHKKMWLLKLGHHIYPNPEYNVLRIISLMVGEDVEYVYDMLPSDLRRGVLQIKDQNQLRIIRVNRAELLRLRTMMTTDLLANWNVDVVQFDFRNPNREIYGHWLFIDGMADRERILAEDFILLSFWGGRFYQVIDGVANNLSGLLKGSLDEVKVNEYYDEREVYDSKMKGGNVGITESELKVLKQREVLYNEMNDRLKKIEVLIEQESSEDDNSTVRMGKVMKWIQIASEQLKGLTNMTQLEDKVDLINQSVVAVGNEIADQNITIQAALMDVRQLKDDNYDVKKELKTKTSKIDLDVKEISSDINNILVRIDDLNLTFTTADNAMSERIDALNNSESEILGGPQGVGKLEIDKINETVIGLNSLMVEQERLVSDTLAHVDKTMAINEKAMKSVNGQLINFELSIDGVRDFIEKNVTDKMTGMNLILKVVEKSVKDFNDRYDEKKLVILDKILKDGFNYSSGDDLHKFAQLIKAQLNRVLTDCKIHGSIRMFAIPAPGAFGTSSYAFATAYGDILVRGYDISKFRISYYPKYTIENYVIRYDGPILKRSYTAIIKEIANSDHFHNLKNVQEIDYLSYTILFGEIDPSNEIVIDGMIYLTDHGFIGV